MSDQSGQDNAPADERVERLVRTALLDRGLDALVREVDEVAAEGELTDTPRPPTSRDRVRALLEAAEAHFRDRAIIAESTQATLADLSIERAVFIDPEGRERTAIARGEDWATERQAAAELETILNDYFR